MVKDESMTNGCPIKIRIFRGEENITVKDSKFSEQSEHFIGGILKYYKALLHFLAPSPMSIERLVPGNRVGSFIFWGIDNVEAPINVSSDYF